jgi:hypothetical protein
LKLATCQNVDLNWFGSFRKRQISNSMHNVHTTLVDMCAGLLKNNFYSDMQIEVLTGEKTDVFSYFLKSRSRIFQTMIETKPIDSTDRIIKVDCAQEVLDAFLHHLYTFQCELPKSKDLIQTFVLADLAQQHGFPELGKFCADYIISTATLENANEIYNLGLKFGNDAVRIHVAGIWLISSPWALFDMEIMSTPLNLVRDYVGSDNAACTGELALLNREYHVNSYTRHPTTNLVIAQRVIAVLPKREKCYAIVKQKT